MEYIFRTDGYEVSEEELDLGLIQMAIEEDIEYTAKELHQLVERFENRYRTTVRAIALGGLVGTWRGHFQGGKMIGDDPEKAFYAFDNCEIIRVGIDEDSLVEFESIHHDGKHRMNLYVLTNNQLQKMGLSDDFSLWDYSEYETLVDEGSPAKADKVFKSAFGL